MAGNERDDRVESLLFVGSIRDDINASRFSWRGRGGWEGGRGRGRMGRGAGAWWVCCERRNDFLPFNPLFGFMFFAALFMYCVVLMVFHFMV